MVSPGSDFFNPGPVGVVDEVVSEGVAFGDNS